MHSAKDKWDRIYSDKDDQSPAPCYVLQRYECLLPESGTALDIACGLGANALFLAKKGRPTTAVDISENATGKLKVRADSQQLPLRAIAEDAANFLSCVNPEEKFDVIVVSRFLDRSLMPAIIGRLNAGGLLFYQTFVRDKVDESVGPSNPHYLLAPNELLALCEPLLVRAFYDPGRIGGRCGEPRNESYLIAQKMESA